MIGPDRDIPAPDLGTNEQVMSWVMDTYSQHKGHSVPGVVTGKPIELGGSFGRREATGRGVVSCAKDACRHLGLAFEGARVVVQGYGAVGATAARIAATLGAHVIAVSDAKSGVVNPRGLDLERLDAFVHENRFVEGFPDAEAVSNADLLELPCEILIPAAIQNQITEKNAERIRCRLLVEGANGPTSLEADAILARRGIFVVPDILANAGGVTVSYFEWVQGLQHFLWTEQEVNNRLIELMQQAFREVLAVAVAQGLRPANGGADARHRPHHRSQAAARDLSLTRLRARLRSAVEQQRRDPEEREEAEDVGEGRDDHAGAERGVELQRLEQQRHGRADEARHAIVDHHRQHEREPEPGVCRARAQAKPALTTPVTAPIIEPDGELLARPRAGRVENSISPSAMPRVITVTRLDAAVAAPCRRPPA